MKASELISDCFTWVVTISNELKRNDEELEDLKKQEIENNFSDRSQSK